MTKKTRNDSPRTPYAVLAKLVEELNEENERLAANNKFLVKDLADMTIAHKKLTVENERLSRENKVLIKQRDLNNNRIHELVVDRGRFRAEFIAKANEMADLLSGNEARNLAKNV